MKGKSCLVYICSGCCCELSVFCRICTVTLLGPSKKDDQLMDCVPNVHESLFIYFYNLIDLVLVFINTSLVWIPTALVNCSKF